MDIWDLSIGATVIAAGAFLLAYIKKVKRRLRRFILRQGEGK